MRQAIRCFICLIATCTFSLYGDEGGKWTFPFVDQAGKDSTFLRFRSHLMQALQEDDTSALKASIAEDVDGGVGGPHGREAFMSFWRTDTSQAGFTDLKRRMLDILEKGGVFIKEDQFVAPYYFGLFLKNRRERVRAVIEGRKTDEASPGFPCSEDSPYCGVIVDTAHLHPEPDSSSHSIDTLFRNAVSIVETTECASSFPPGCKWVGVRLPSGVEGFVMGKKVRHLMGWRLYFTEKEGRWIITKSMIGFDDWW